MPAKRGDIDNCFKSTHEIVLDFIPKEGGISEEYLFDKLGVLGYSDFEVDQILIELADNGVIYRKAGVWCIQENAPDHFNISNKVGYRVERKHDGKKFVVSLSGDLASLDPEDSEYVLKESWLKGYQFGLYKILCFCCLESTAVKELITELPICYSCAMHLTNHFEIEEDEVYIRELIYSLREDEDQISRQDLNYVNAA